MTILESQIQEVISGRRGFISLPALRRLEPVYKHLDQYAIRRIVEDCFPNSGLIVERHGRHGFCIFRGKGSREVTSMTQPQAEALAKMDRSYVARPIPNTKWVYWGVWCGASDHWVEFDRETISNAG